ncbi:hypothetical protein EJ06DRAFT_556041 [Trichodelitschia bisporula]|uniref:Box C/D snoRNA protein 1 n=1 Tax=Trichodelitschia bisporula TaxID=703511 RepID=A0A6G1HZK6_9PEZI|nr:hypothetical protein EJ06DRAFT_556041 [Trichodelitschia bisporula]
MADAPLSTLCSICHALPPRYTCPRCSTKTCSLPCITLHKARTSCTGIRDATAYKPRKELATAAGIDHDYNFLKRLEDARERSKRSLPEAVIPTPGYKNVKAARRLEHKCREAGVTVIKPPAGIGRAREDRTRVTNAHKLLWTVEWCLPQGERRLAEVDETTSLEKAYETVVKRPKRDARRAGLDTEKAGTEGKKAKREEQGNPVSEEGGAVSALASDTAALDVNVPDADAPVPAEVSTEVTPAAPTSERVYLYLAHPPNPSITGKRTILSPIPEGACLNAVLRGQTVLAFPTIVVLAEEPGEVAGGKVEGYILANVPAEEERGVLEGRAWREEGFEDNEDSSEEEESEESSEDDESEDEASEEDQSGEGSRGEELDEEGPSEGHGGADGDLAIVDENAVVVVQDAEDDEMGTQTHAAENSG